MHTHTRNPKQVPSIKPPCFVNITVCTYLPLRSVFFVTVQSSDAPPLSPTQERPFKSDVALLLDIFHEVLRGVSAQSVMRVRAQA